MSKNKKILILVIPLITLLISFFFMKFLFSINNILINYIACIINIIFDLSLDIFGFIAIVYIAFLFDKN